MPFLIDPVIWETLPDTVLVVAAADDVDNARDRPAGRALLHETQEAMRTTWAYENAQSHPYVAAWRETFTSWGVSGKKFRSSVEALCRRAGQGHRAAWRETLVREAFVEGFRGHVAHEPRSAILDRHVTRWDWE